MPIALLHRPDPHHATAQTLAATFANQRRPRLATTAVLAELGDGFARKKRWEILNAFLDTLAKDTLVTILPVDRVLLEWARHLRNARADRDWGLTDCFSLVAMTDHGLEEAFTADHHFQQAGFRALLLEG